jgi:DNA-binding CsgD family transcriptional regulator
LGISSTTVRTHLENAFRKVGVSSRAGLVHKLSA